jgi:hypothetical protein
MPIWVYLLLATVLVKIVFIEHIIQQVSLNMINITVQQVDMKQQ